MRLLNIVLAAAAVCLAGAVATASAQTIDACVMKNGILKVLDDGAECLPQETPITLGQSQQPAVGTARVFDGEGRDVGAFIDFQDGVWRVLLADLGVIALMTDTGLSPRNYRLIGYPDIIFGLAGCEGPRYVGTPWSNTLFPDPLLGDAWLIGSTNQQWAIPMVSLLKPNGECEETGSDPRTTPRALTVQVEEFNQDLGDTFSRPHPIWIGSSSDSP